MATVFMWNYHELFVDSKQIKSFSDWNMKSAYVTEESGETKKNKPAKTKPVGPDKGTISLKISLSELQGVNVKEEVLWWREQCNLGTQAEIYLGLNGQFQIGEYKWLITEVTQTNLIILPDGTWKSCELALTFEEYYVKVKNTKLEKKQAKLSKKLAKQQAKMEKKILKGKDTSKVEKKIAKLATQYNEVTLAVARETSANFSAKYSAHKQARDYTASFLNAGVTL